MGAPARDAKEAAEFVLTSARSRHTLITIAGFGEMRATSLGAIASEEFIEGYREPALLADDLAVIERYAGTRFRMPATYSPLERVRVRNARLMYEGLVVAEPASHGTVSLTLNGDGEAEITKLLSPHGIWLGWSTPHAQIEFFGNVIEVPELRYTALISAIPTSARKIRRAFRMNRAADAVLTMSMREGDCVRAYMPDRVAPESTVDITPWGLPGIAQEGLLTPALG